MGTRTNRSNTAAAHSFTGEIYRFPVSLDYILLHHLGRRPHSGSRKPMLYDGGAFVGCCWMVAAHSGVVAHRHRILQYEWVVCDCEYYFRRCRTVRTQGLAPHTWLTTQRLHGAKMLGVRAYNIFYLIPILKNLTVVSGTRTFAKASQATQIFLLTPSISQEAHSRPTSNFSQHFSSPGCSM